MKGDTLVLIIVAVIGSGGLSAFATTLIKARPEAGAILINAAQDVVLIQKGTIDDLAERVQRAESRAQAAEERAERAEAEVRSFEIENEELRRRLDVLEARDRNRPD